MEKTIIPLHPTESQLHSLLALQKTFAEVCNAIAITARETRCWNRVALHHLVYKNMREQFPAIGSQMVCNAIYSVSRTSRLVFQHPKSPFLISKNSTAPLPLLRFLPDAPVYFDRHTLSIKGGNLSLYTLDGRLRFRVSLNKAQEQLFQSEKLIEVALLSSKGQYRLHFLLGERTPTPTGSPTENDTLEFPNYVLINQDKEMSPSTLPTTQGVAA